MSWWHTPGPWKAIDNYNEMPVGCDGFVIESVDGMHIIPDGMQRLGCEKADARLIAAAPELLAVLKELEESAEYWSEYDVPIGIVYRIRAAIAKAEGKP